MRIIIGKDYADMSRKAANVIAAQMIQKPNSILGLATGSTPIGTYERLVELNKKGDIDFSNCMSFNLDEYLGLDETNDQSYRYFMDTNLFNHVNIDKAKTNMPSGMSDDLDKECLEYEARIKEAGGVDLQLLGLGHNGHIGFNEPGDNFEAITHIVDLDEKTIKANARFFENEDMVPKKAITMGIKTIMQARQIVIVVSGEDKADILNQVVNGPITPKVQGSILQLHDNVIVVADEAAASKL